MSYRIIYMGTPDFAVPPLHALAEQVTRDSLRVVTQPDRPAGRGRRLQSAPVRKHAAELGLEVIQPGTLRDPDIRQQLSAFAPDLIVVAAFGLLLPKWVLELPPNGCVNLHASLLPRFRGASPVAAAIARGDSHTGVALMQMERGLDTGSVYAVNEMQLRSQDTTESLTARLAYSAAELLTLHLQVLLDGASVATPQRGQIVETRKLVKDHGAIDWRQPAEAIERLIRAMWPWPKAWTETEDGIRVQVHQATLFDHPDSMISGQIAHIGGRLAVATEHGWLALERIQLAGKTAQPATELMGHPSFTEGTRLGKPKTFQSPAPWIIPAGDTA